MGVAKAALCLAGLAAGLALAAAAAAAAEAAEQPAGGLGAAMATGPLRAAQQAGGSPSHSEGDDDGPKLTLWPLDGVDIALFAICAACLSLAGGAGIGGGAVLVPAFILIRGWPTAVAVAMSNVTVLGGSFANFICNVRRHRPSGQRTIDWELILMMEPTTIAGALFGAMLNKILPNWMTIYLLTIMLTFMAIRLYSKGREAYNKETALLQAANQAAKVSVRHQRAAEREREHAARDTGTPRHADAVPIRGGGPPSRSGSSIFGRSLQRLQAPLLAEVPDHHHHLLNSPTARTPSGLRSLRHGSSFAARAGSGAPRRGALATGSSEGLGGEAAVQQVAPWLPGVLSQNPHRQLLDALDCSTLCQGDMVGTDVEPVVALPLDTVPSGSDSEGGLPPDADPERGGELTRPLLAGDADGADRRAPDFVALVHSGGDDDVAEGRLDTSGGGGAVAIKGVDSALAPASHAAHLGFPKEVVLERSLPLPHFFTLLLLSAWVVSSDVAQGGTVCGSWQWWAVTLSVLAPVGLILFVFRSILLRKYRHDELAPGTELPEGQLHWTTTTTVLYPALCTTAGLIAGLFGIGGGVVKGPLMIELGVPPDVAAATSATMIMFTAGSACVVYSRFGQLLLDYGVLMILLGFFVTLSSQLLTFLLIKALGRRSVVVFMMVVLMCMASSVMYVQSFLEAKNLYNHPEELWRFGSLCPKVVPPDALRALFALLGLGQ